MLADAKGHKPTLRADLMKSPMMDLLWPSCAMEKVPSLFSFMTAGMEGNTRHASRRSRWGPTTAVICRGEGCIAGRTAVGKGAGGGG